MTIPAPVKPTSIEAAFLAILRCDNGALIRGGWCKSWCGVESRGFLFPNADGVWPVQVATTGSSQNGAQSGRDIYNYVHCHEQLSSEGSKIFKKFVLAIWSTNNLTSST